MDRPAVHIDLRLPDDDEEAAGLIEAAERLYPNNPLGVFWLNYLRRLAEGDYDLQGCEGDLLPFPLLHSSS